MRRLVASALLFLTTIAEAAPPPRRPSRHPHGRSDERREARRETRSKLRPRPAEPVEEGEDGASKRLRAAWWMRQRAFPGDRVPDGAFERAVVRFAELGGRVEPGAPRLTMPDPSHPWREIGPAPLDPPSGTPNSGALAGRLRALAVDPRDPRVIYAGAAQGGLWKSADGGATWTALGDGLPSLAIGAIAIDGAAPDTIWAGTGEADFGQRGHGLLRSTDGGATWIRPAGQKFAGAGTTGIAVDPETHAIYVATTAASSGVGSGCTNYYADPDVRGLFRSTDGGVSWTRLVDGGVRDFEIDFSAHPREIFYSVAGGGAFHLVEGGAPEALSLPGPRSTPAGSDIELALAPSDPRVLYAGLAIGGDTSHLFVSTDHGRTFREIQNAPNYCYSQCYFTNVLTVHPTDPETLFIGGGLCSVWRGNRLLTAPVFRAISLPGGNCGANFANWYLGYVHPDAHAITVLPGPPETLLVATDGGLFKTDSGGADWTALNDGVGTVQFYGICVDPKDPAHLFGGAQDNGSLETAGDGVRWAGVITGDGGPCVAAAESANGGDPHAVLSNDQAEIFIGGTAAPGGYDLTFATTYCKKTMAGCGDRAGFIAPVAADPQKPATVYVGTYRLWRSDDGGALGTWSAASDDLSYGKGGVRCTNGASDDDYLSAIAVAPSSSEVVYTGSAGGRLQRTDDRGGRWIEIGGAGLPRRWVSAIAVDAHDPRTVWVAYSGFSATTPNQPGHVFRSTDGGATFAPRDIGVDVPVDALIAHPIESGVLFAGTDVGALASFDGGATWTPLPGLPGLEVLSLAYHAGARTLYAGTHGRGAWARTFNRVLSADPPALRIQIDRGRSAQADAVVKIRPGDPGAAIDFTVRAAAAFPLTVDPGAGRTIAADVPVTAHIDAANLAPGEYDATITVEDPAAQPASLDIPVHVTVSGSGGCACRAGGASRPSGLLLCVLPLAILLRLRPRLLRRRARR